MKEGLEALPVSIESSGLKRIILNKSIITRKWCTRLGMMISSATKCLPSLSPNGHACTQLITVFLYIKSTCIKMAVQVHVHAHVDHWVALMSLGEFSKKSLLFKLL